MKILIYEHPENTPTKFLDNGELYFDLKEDTRIRITKKVKDLYKYEDLKGEGILGFSLPSSDKNYFILNKYIHNTLDFNFEPITIRLFVDGVYLPYTQLRVKSYDDNTKEFSVELSDQEFNVKDKAKQLTLNNINLGNSRFVMGSVGDAEGVLHYWNSPDYIDIAGSNPVRYGFGNFGRYLDYYSNKLCANDMRMFVSLHALLKQGFCELGYSFSTDFYNSQWYRKIYLYCMGKDFYKYNSGNKIFFKISKDSNSYLDNTTENQTQDDWTIVQDSNNMALPVQTFVNISNESGVTCDLGLNVDLIFRASEVVNGNGSTRGTLLSVMNSVDGGYIVLTVEHLRALPNPDSIRYYCKSYEIPDNITELNQFEINDNIQFDIIDWRPEDTLRVSLIGSNDYFDSLLDGTDINPDTQTAINNAYLGNLIFGEGTIINTFANGRHLYLGDEHIIKNFLSSEYTFDELLRGLSHMGFRFDFNILDRKVEMFAEQNTSIHYEAVDGYFKPTRDAINVSNYIQPESLKVEFKSQDLSRYKQFQFKNTSDAYTDSLDLSLPLYSRIFDFGKYGFDNSETDESENPFFEATSNSKLQLLSFTKDINLPAITDNLDTEGNPHFTFGTLSTDIQPRILIFDNHSHQYSRFYNESEDLVVYTKQNLPFEYPDPLNTSTKIQVTQTPNFSQCFDFYTSIENTGFSDYATFTFNLPSISQVTLNDVTLNAISLSSVVGFNFPYNIPQDASNFVNDLQTYIDSDPTLSGTVSYDASTMKFRISNASDIGNNYTTYNYAYTDVDGIVVSGVGIFSSSVSELVRISEYSVVYGYKYDDLFNTMLKFPIADILKSNLHKYLLNIDANLYRQLDFRTPLLIEYGSIVYPAKLLEINDYLFTDIISTPITVCPIPEKLLGCFRTCTYSINLKNKNIFDIILQDNTSLKEAYSHIFGFPYILDGTLPEQEEQELRLQSDIQQFLELYFPVGSAFVNYPTLEVVATAAPFYSISSSPQPNGSIFQIDLFTQSNCE